MKPKVYWCENTESYHGQKYLEFTENELGWFEMSTDKDGIIGRIILVKVGAWSHWCIYLDKDCYLSPGCNDEAREMQRILGSRTNEQRLAQIKSNTKQDGN